ncbi:hypothetical protein POM88_053532 [Heracleum sosnowskyi]|uniref:C3H1-type domain-containing protein n=1 Tax=Heracleum sosnowskyi TaxID=360622 RepID=A0AAD8GPK1_9APIA|nr:hypothetical protein POM88_053532 [Heracleum sosnowskyi]
MQIKDGIQIWHQMLKAQSLGTETQVCPPRIWDLMFGDKCKEMLVRDGQDSGPSGNANQGWASPAKNQGNNRSQHHRNGDRFSGKKYQGSQPGRNWNKQPSYGGGCPRHGSRGICYMFRDTGHCKRGYSCNFRHSS